VTVSSAIRGQYNLISVLPEGLSHPGHYFGTNPGLIAEKNHNGLRLRVDCAYAGAVRRSAPLTEHRIVDDPCRAEVDALADFISRSAKDNDNFIKGGAYASLTDNPFEQRRPAVRQELLWLPEAG
jgi:hypothetical protein